MSASDNEPQKFKLYYVALMEGKVIQFLTDGPFVSYDTAINAKYLREQRTCMFKTHLQVVSSKTEFEVEVE